MKADGGPAFPVHANHAWFNGAVVSVHEQGMTLRDWFAGQETLADFDSPEVAVPKFTAEALAGRKKPDCTKDDWIELIKWEAEWRARLKFIRADAMLRARDRGQEGGAQ